MTNTLSGITGRELATEGNWRRRRFHFFETGTCAPPACLAINTSGRYIGEFADQNSRFQDPAFSRGRILHAVPVVAQTPETKPSFFIHFD